MKKNLDNRKMEFHYNEPKWNAPKHILPPSQDLDFRKNPGIWARVMVEQALQNFEGVNTSKLETLNVNARDLVKYRYLFVRSGEVIQLSVHNLRKFIYVDDPVHAHAGASDDGACRVMDHRILDFVFHFHNSDNSGAYDIRLRVGLASARGRAPLSNTKHGSPAASNQHGTRGIHDGGQRLPDLL